MNDDFCTIDMDMSDEMSEEDLEKSYQETREHVRYVFKNEPKICNELLDNVELIGGGDTDMKRLLLNSIVIFSSPVIVNHGEIHTESIKESKYTFPVRNMAMQTLTMVYKLVAEKIKEHKTTIDNLQEAISMIGNKLP